MLSSLVFALASVLAEPDMAKPSFRATRQLHASPSIYLSEDFASNRTVTHLLQKLPVAESAWTPCIGQTREFAAKRCTLLQVGEDSQLRGLLAQIESSFQVSTAALVEGGLPIIRYLPGAPAVGVHGDVGASGVVPNMTLVLYLTDAEHGDGHTHFPHLGVEVEPKRGSILSFANVGADGHPDPASKHGVTQVSKYASRDRMVVQIPILLQQAGDNGLRGFCYPEHVSGSKHMIHIGGMVLILGGYLIYQYLYGSGSFLVAYGADGRM